MAGLFGGGGFLGSSRLSRSWLAGVGPSGHRNERDVLVLRLATLAAPLRCRDIRS